jgi:hypothetical protein
MVRFLREQRRVYGVDDQPFDIVLGGASPVGQSAARDVIGPLSDAGVTWWDERMPWGPDLSRTDPMLRRIDAGPPSI